MGLLIIAAEFSWCALANRLGYAELKNRGSLRKYKADLLPIFCSYNFSMVQGEQEARWGSQHLTRLCDPGRPRLLLRCGLTFGHPKSFSCPRLLRTSLVKYINNQVVSLLGVSLFCDDHKLCTFGFNLKLFASWFDYIRMKALVKES